MFKSFLILTLKGIRHRQLRSWLTILGVVIGISLVVIILALGSGIQSAVSSQMQMFGTNLIIVFPGKETNPFVGILGGQKFQEKDIIALENIPGIDIVIPNDQRMMTIEYQGQKETIMVNGAPWEGMKRIFEESQGVGLSEGKWPDNNTDNEIVLGYIPSTTLFRRPVRIGDEVIIKAKRLRVVGMISEVGNQVDDNTVYVSRNIFETITGERGNAAAAMIKAEDGADIELVSRQIRFELEKQEAVRDFAVITPEKAGQLVGGVLEIVEIGLIFIALISLLVGAVGIMNTMYTSVLERTKQIGIMKAIGASSEAILSLFLLESGLIGVVGGVLGIAFGILMAYLFSIGAEQAGIGGLFSFKALDFYGLGVVLIVTFIVGVLSGVLPARRAAKMEPAEALRYE